MRVFSLVQLKFFHQVVESECNVEFMRHIIPSLHWQSVLVAASAVGFQGLPNEVGSDILQDQEFLEAMHRLLLDIHILEGFLICPDTGRKFPISEGIPNMM